MSTQTAPIDELKAIIEQTLNRRTRSPWFDTKGAAGYLGSTPGTLKVWRSTGRGPRFHGQRRFVRYHLDDLDAFLRGE